MVGKIVKQIPEIKYARKIITTAHCHMISASYSYQELTGVERRVFLWHMDHRPEMSHFVYQCQSGVVELLRVGRIFQYTDVDNIPKCGKTTLDNLPIIGVSGK